MPDDRTRCTEVNGLEAVWTMKKTRHIEISEARDTTTGEVIEYAPGTDLAAAREQTRTGSAVRNARRGDVPAVAAASVTAGADSPHTPNFSCKPRRNCAKTAETGQVCTICSAVKGCARRSGEPTPARTGITEPDSIHSDPDPRRARQALLPSLPWICS